MVKRSKRERERYDTFRSLLLFFSSYDARRRLCRTHRSIRKVNTYHICMYWTLMSKAVHDLFWHSSISFWWWLHRCTIFYVNILWYTNNTHTHTCPVIRFRYVYVHLICILMKTIASKMKLFQTMMITWTNKSNSSFSSQYQLKTNIWCCLQLSLAIRAT